MYAENEEGVYCVLFLYKMEVVVFLSDSDLVECLYNFCWCTFTEDRK
jgi:hypothetical protein